MAKVIKIIVLSMSFHEIQIQKRIKAIITNSQN
jgi:hypothetical protein